MVYNEQINAYKKTQQSSTAVTSSHEIVRTLMKELVNSMQKIVLDIQDERSRKKDQLYVDKAFEEKNARHKSKNLSKSLKTTKRDKTKTLNFQPVELTYGMKKRK